MAYGKGFRAIGGFKKSTTWGTPVAAGANDGFEYVTEGLTPDSQFIPDVSLTGRASKLFGDKGNEFHSGDVEMDVRYEGIERFFAMAMGTAGAPSQVASDNAYKHVFKINDDKEGLHGTLVFNKQVGVWEYTTAKVGGFNLSIKNGTRLRAKFPMIPQGLNINTGAGTNTNATVANITMPSNRDFALFSQMVVKINAHDGGALANADLVYLSEFEVSLDNSYPTDDVTTRYGYLIDEPIQDGFTMVTGKIAFSKYFDGTGGNDALLSAMLSKARKKMTVTFTGPIANGTTNFSITLYFPDVQFSGGDANVGGPGRIPVNLSFEAHRRTAVPTGFPATYQEAVTMEMVNQKSTDALA